jgi:hypothetical protein
VSDQCGCAGGGDGVVVVVVRLRKQWIVALEVHAEASATKGLVRVPSTGGSRAFHNLHTSLLFITNQKKCSQSGHA